MIKRTFTPYTPEKKTYPQPSPNQWEQLQQVPISKALGLTLRPVKVVLDNNQILENVYFAKASEYIKVTGVWPEDDPDKKSIAISQVKNIESSPNRLPRELSDELYLAGETSMGGVTFTVLFSDGTTQVYDYGNLLDFVTLPNGKKISDIADIEAHKGVDEKNRLRHPKFYWCLFD